MVFKRAISSYSTAWSTTNLMRETWWGKAILQNARNSLVFFFNDAQRLLWLQTRVLLHQRGLFRMSLVHSQRLHIVCSANEDCLSQRNCVDGSQGHPVFMYVYVCVRVSTLSGNVNRHEIVYARGIVLIVIKVSVCVCFPTYKFTHHHVLRERQFFLWTTYSNLILHHISTWRVHVQCDLCARLAHAPLAVVVHAVEAVPLGVELREGVSDLGNLSGGSVPDDVGLSLVDPCDLLTNAL